MYSDIHVAVGTKRRIHGNTDTTEQYTYNITHPLHVQQSAIDTQNHMEGNMDTSITTPTTRIQYPAISMQHYIYSQYTHNLTYATRRMQYCVSSNAQMQQHIHQKCVQYHIHSNVHKTAHIQQCACNAIVTTTHMQHHVHGMQHYTCSNAHIVHQH